MDSMRSLNRSLPRTSPQRRTQQQQIQPPPEDLLTAFKAAALSVTTLYKSAKSLQIPARAAGYQEALEDLLNFLDKENLGLGDGEGWRVRQWATERLDGNATVQHESDEEEEEHVDAEDDKLEDNNHTVPTEPRQPAHTEDLSSSGELPSKENTSTTTQQPEARQTPPPPPGSQTAFTFRSPHTLPTNHDRDTNMDGVANDSRQTDTHNTTHQSAKQEASPRHVRTRQPRLPNHRSNNSLRNSLGAGAGSKRRFPLGDFFDLSGINFDSKDGGDRGGKRNKHN
ncbi:hypothetical protein K461DRAFT_265315 [Myriangium duriaei CBS 260.36]|uniref:Uncharacterized protein n=1 Tax=Myriangium duriaei CBS 260.36 TaxID=1168546 RepID=A0A9P4JB83_9PEZI|nr:hypothetical protein K461DRAFT_265315 [Myriangium duriaei CBS 260.36]